MSIYCSVSVVADVGQLEQLAVARGVPDHSAVARHAPRARQVLAHRPRRQRARRRHLLRQPADAYVLAHTLLSTETLLNCT